MLCHVYFTFKLRLVQRHTLKGIRYTFHPEKSTSGIGTYAAFASALGTTIGPGNITGVAVAVSMGGVGAVLWMWICGVLAMSTKYAESCLALKYRDNGVGGTMVLLRLLGNRRLSVFWSVFCALGCLFMGAAVPVSSLAGTLPLPRAVTGAVITVFVIITVSFGFGGISKVCSLLVPVMSAVFLLFSLFIIAVNASEIPNAISRMFSEAFSFSALAGGGLGVAVREGVTRGLYSNESGLGSGGVLAAESGDKNITLGALSAMTTVFWDTVVMCAVTGVMLAVTGAKRGDDPDVILHTAFNTPVGNVLLPLSMTCFVFATVIGWYYIAKRVLTYSFKKTALFDVMFISACFFGAVVTQKYLWRVSDAVNILMLLPSLYTLVRMKDKINLYINNN